MKRVEKWQLQAILSTRLDVCEIGIYRNEGLFATLTGRAANVGNQWCLPPYETILTPSFHTENALKFAFGLPFAQERPDAVDYFYGRPRLTTLG